MNDIKDYENIALSDTEVLKLINGKANLIIYPNIHKYKTMDELLGPNGACVLLYESKPNYGHWCCIFKINDNLLEYFNPYGGFHEGFPDDNLQYIPIDFRKKSNQYYPYLSILMYNSPYKLSYNEFRFQKYGRNIKTCGRWVALRIIFRNLSLKDFHYLIESLKKKFGIDSDKLVTLLTLYIRKI